MRTRRPHRAAQRTEEGAEDALLRVGPPWRVLGLSLWAVFTRESATTSNTKVFRRDVFLDELRRRAAKGEHDAPMLLDVIRSCEKHRDGIPHLIAHAGGTDLDFLRPSDEAEA